MKKENEKTSDILSKLIKELNEDAAGQSGLSAEVRVHDTCHEIAEISNMYKNMMEVVHMEFNKLLENPTAELEFGIKPMDLVFGGHNDKFEFIMKKHPGAEGLNFNTTEVQSPMKKTVESTNSNLKANKETG